MDSNETGGMMNEWAKGVLIQGHRWAPADVKTPLSTFSCFYMRSRKASDEVI